MKLFINNKKNQKICVEVDGLENTGNKKLAFLVHGLSVDRHQPELKMASKAFVANGFVVVRFDSRFTFGESYGDLEGASLSNSVEDLSTVINWASSQDFYAEPFALSGHSLGGGAVLEYAEKNPDMVSLLVPISPIVSGQLMVDAWRKTEIRAKMLNEMETTGKSFRNNRYNPEKSGYVSYDFIKDALKYDFVKNADELDMPVLLITGDADVSSTVYNNSKLFEALKGDVSFEIISDVGHNFDDDRSQRDLYKAIYNWVEGKI